MEKASLDEVMNDERIRQSSNCFAIASSSFDSRQESTWTVNGSWNKWYSGYGNSKIADNMFGDDVIIINIYLVRMSECDEEEKILIDSGDETCDLTFIMYLNILINCNHFRKNIKMVMVERDKKNANKNMQYQRKHYLSKYHVNDIVLVEDSTQVVNEYFDEAKVLISRHVSIIYVMNNISLVGVIINMVEVQSIETFTIQRKKRKLHNVSLIQNTI